ncbi:TonB-dependent receptor plug domain-containing protein [Parvularcula lutaonensis]|uniref:TonB-dependent receptor plug domain-containing protein n=1 Tax=Parvularcula lutaonensis TaxID=491923 RepID=A0ABV7M8X2_9PROT|nr:TonB-dependent receptor [Parvularcula lutaonensis]GGY56229.1 ligand-gated channel [Parvularcula lutaonensis]
MKRKLLLAVSLSLLSTPAFAHDAGQDPDTIVVYGSRLDQTLAEAGTAVTILTREDLERQGYAFAIDALASAPGVTLNQSGGLGGAATIRIRGAASDQTLVLIDGVPVGDTSAPGGGFDFARLDTDQTERIEILRGPQSTLWGSEAIGGVVSITTRSPEPGAGVLSQGAVFAEVGSFDSYRGGVRGTLGNQQHNLRIGITSVVSDGFSKADEDAGNTEDDGFRSTSASLRHRSDFGAALLDTGLYVQTAETEFDSFDFLAPGFVADGDERSETDELTGHVALSTPEDKIVSHRLFAGYSQIDRSNFTGEVPAFDARGERNILRYQLTADAPDWPVAVTLGAERDGREANDEETSIASGFALAALKPTAGLTLTGGVRIDDHEQFGSETTGRIAVSWQAHPALTLRGNWGQGFKAPSLFQQTFFCCGATAVPVGLMPERSEGFDIGALYFREGFNLEIGYFELDTDDLIDFSFALGGYDNIARAETRGIETAWSVSLPRKLVARGSYTWLEAEDGAGNALARLPEHSGDASLSYEGETFRATFILRHNGEETDSFGTVDAWTRLDASLSYDVSEKAEIYLRAENLTDTDYQQVFGYGTAGASATVGIRLSQ